MTKHFLIPSDDEGFPISFDWMLSSGEEIQDELKRKLKVSFVKMPSEDNYKKQRWTQKGGKSPALGIMSSTMKGFEDGIKGLLDCGESFRLKTYDYDGEKSYLLLYAEEKSLWDIDV